MSIVFASSSGMDTGRDRIALIYDEDGFSRVCSALLKMSGCVTEVMDGRRDAATRLRSEDVGVFITSYPYGAFMLEEVRKRRIPSVVLLDNNGELYGERLDAYDDLYCMIKPIDYDKFKSLVHQLLSEQPVSRDGFTVK